MYLKFKIHAGYMWDTCILRGNQDTCWIHQGCMYLKCRILCIWPRRQWPWQGLCQWPPLSRPARCAGRDRRPWVDGFGWSCEVRLCDPCARVSRVCPGSRRWGCRTSHFFVGKCLCHKSSDCRQMSRHDIRHVYQVQVTKTSETFSKRRDFAS